MVGTAGCFPLRLCGFHPDCLGARRPLHQPDLFHLANAIAVAFDETTVSGELPYYLGQSLQVMLYGLSIAIVVGVILGVATARLRWLDWATRPAHQIH